MRKSKLDKLKGSLDRYKLSYEGLASEPVKKGGNGENS